MKVITLDNGDMYFAENVEGNNINNAVKISDCTKGEMCRYLKITALGEAINIEFSSQTGYTMSDLTADQKKEFDNLKDIFAEASRKAQAFTINSVFDKLVAKYGK